jgi:hypothetical protein
MVSRSGNCTRVEGGYARDVVVDVAGFRYCIQVYAEQKAALDDDAVMPTLENLCTNATEELRFGWAEAQRAELA